MNKNRSPRKPETVVARIAVYASLIRGHCDSCAISNQKGFRRLIKELRASLRAAKPRGDRP